MAKICVLDEYKECTNCGECEMCDLDPNKKCDNCMKCVNTEGAEFRGIQIDDVEVPENNEDNQAFLEEISKQIDEEE